MRQSGSDDPDLHSGVHIVRFPVLFYVYKYACVSAACFVSDRCDLVRKDRGFLVFKSEESAARARKCFGCDECDVGIGICICIWNRNAARNDPEFISGNPLGSARVMCRYDIDRIYEETD